MKAKEREEDRKSERDSTTYVRGFSTTSQLLLTVIVIIMQRPNATVHLERKGRRRTFHGTEHKRTNLR